MTAPQLNDHYVVCNTCHGRFSQRENSFVEHNDDIETVGLQCPHCGARYVAYRTNGAIRALQAKVQREMERYRRRVAAGVPPERAERKLRRARQVLERAYKAFNGKA